MNSFNKEEFKKIKFLVLDFDGVLTDNRVLAFENGKEAVFCSRSDSLGIEMLKKNGIDIAVISKEKNNVVRARCKKLKIECLSGIDKKKEIFLNQIKKRDLVISEVCYIGNDINDLECIKSAGIGVAVADAYEQVLQNADYISRSKGGMGAIREIADLILVDK